MEGPIERPKAVIKSSCSQKSFCDQSFLKPAIFSCNLIIKMLEDEGDDDDDDEEEDEDDDGDNDQDA